MRRLNYPLYSLTYVMEEIQSNNSSIRYKRDPFGFEINTLGETFNETVNTLLENKALAENERVKVEVYKKELALGEEIQKRLYVDKKTVVPELDLAVRYQPALEVGGDFCDLFLDKGRLILMIADAAGKGVEGCFYSLLGRSMLRIFSKEFSDVLR